MVFYSLNDYLNPHEGPQDMGPSMLHPNLWECHRCIEGMTPHRQRSARGNLRRSLVCYRRLQQKCIMTRWHGCLFEAEIFQRCAPLKRSSPNLIGFSSRRVHFRYLDQGAVGLGRRSASSPNYPPNESKSLPNANSPRISRWLKITSG